MAGRGLRRTLTISDQSKPDVRPTVNDGLRRTLTVSDQSRPDFKPNNNYRGDNDDDNNTSTNTSAVDDEFCRSFGRTGIGMPSPVRGGRTLMDIIREEQKMSGSGTGSIRNPVNGTVSWKSFKDRIRLRRTSAAWSEPDPGPELDIGPPSSAPLPPNFARSLTVRGSNNVSAPGPVDNEDEDDDDQPNSNLNLGGGGGGGGNDPGKTSLMDLFVGFGSFDSDADGDEDDEDDEEDEDVDEDDEELYHACCVCMVRHKGAAFIPCGHTFCRLCSRELWVSRGNCPLCNGFILEILDIF